MQYAPFQGFNPNFNQGYQPQQIQPTFAPQANQVPQITGRYVSTVEEITPQEVSMGSTPSLFPLVDGTAIIAKQWANDGTIKTVRYTAELTEDQPNQLTLADIMNQLDNLQDAIDALKPKRTTRKAAQDAED